MILTRHTFATLVTSSGENPGWDRAKSVEEYTKKLARIASSIPRETMMVEAGGVESNYPNFINSLIPQGFPLISAGNANFQIVQ